jgi:archaellum component FlaG (FlaF/FlaG flagellin family)
MLTIFRWMALIAAIVLIAALAGTVVSSQQPLKIAHQETAEKNNQKHEAEKDNKTLWDTWFPDSNSIFTLFLMVFTAVLAFASIIQLTLLNRAERISAKIAQAAKDSADAVNRQVDLMKIDQRPWIGGPVKVHAKLVGGNVIFTTIFRNVGKSPTDGFYIDAEVINGDAINWADESARICRDSTAFAEKGFNIALPEKNFNPYSGIPGANWAVELRDMSSSKGRNVTIDQLKAFKTPLIVGCAVYGSLFR